MLVAIASAKGSPGVTSTALVLASVWPRPVVLLEADPAGSDLAYRCQSVQGGPVLPGRGLLTLAAAVRGGVPGPMAVSEQAQLLACGVSLVPGVGSANEARGLNNLWSTIAEACVASEVDVIADLGRLDRASSGIALAQAADCLLPVATSSLESVMHLTSNLAEMAGAMLATVIRPVLVGPDSHSDSDCADLDELLRRATLAVRPTRPVPFDASALARLENGEKATGRLGRTLLVRSARALAETVLELEGAPR